MAEDTVSPVTASEPPAPLGGSASPASSTMKLKPVIRKPVPGGSSPSQNGLRAGLKLPPKPGLKPSVTLTPKPGLRPGLKLPAKPGATVSALPAGDPASAATAPAPNTVNTMEQLKTITQSMKSITAPIPQQAILRRTGIIADQDLTEAQKMAAKARTSRISLSDAIGVAPVSNENAPMKTIRIKRPTDIGGGDAAPAAAPSPAPAATATESDTTITQRKTLKIARPQGGVRPQGKFGVRKPGAKPGAAKPAAAKPAGDDSEVADLDVADIKDIPAATSTTTAPAGIPDVPKGVAVTGIIFQLAACAVIGVLGWWLWNDFNLPHYCGGCMP